jgi:hypothetical protein
VIHQPKISKHTIDILISSTTWSTNMSPAVNKVFLVKGEDSPLPFNLSGLVIASKNKGQETWCYLTSEARSPKHAQFPLWSLQHLHLESWRVMQINPAAVLWGYSDLMQKLCVVLQEAHPSWTILAVISIRHVSWLRKFWITSPPLSSSLCLLNIFNKEGTIYL